ncbi:MAG: sodium:proton exchanger, partial [Actinomycetota bacterium]|nr:sodium:proton exchanger [Actinomycetota bacterium]
MGAGKKRKVHTRRQPLSLALAPAALVPGAGLRLGGAHAPHPVEAMIFGPAIVGAAFLLSWAAEVAQLDISAGLAIAVLAFIAVLPEYAVGHGVRVEGRQRRPGIRPCVPPRRCRRRITVLSGPGQHDRSQPASHWHRLGDGGALAWFQSRRKGWPMSEVALERTRSVEISVLAVASLYSLSLPLKRTITLMDSAVLVTLFVAYTVRVSKAAPEEPHLEGPAKYVGGFPARRRRVVVAALFVAAAAAILLCAERFAEALVETGADFGVSEFLLVQWLAPLASEAPELLVAGLYAWRLDTNAGLGTLVSSKVNQWTLLVGTLPVVFAVASGSLHGLPILAASPSG